MSVQPASRLVCPSLPARRLARSITFAVGFVLLGSALLPGAPADDGRTPIYQPTTGADPGSYYLTRDIVASTDAITVQGSPVVLDLNGYEVSGGSGWASIRIELDGADFTVRDGHSADRGTGSTISRTLLSRPTSSSRT